MMYGTEIFIGALILVVLLFINGVFAPWQWISLEIGVDEYELTKEERKKFQSPGRKKIRFIKRTIFALAFCIVWTWTFVYNTPPGLQKMRSDAQQGQLFTCRAQLKRNQIMTKQSEKSEMLLIHLCELLGLYDNTPEIFTGKDINNIKILQNLVPKLGFIMSIENTIEKMYHHYITEKRIENE